MSDFLLADGFGNLSDGTHTAGSTRQILGTQWSGFNANFSIEDRADGGKWLKNAGSLSIIRLASGTLASKVTTIAVSFRLIRGGAEGVNIVTLYDGSTLIGMIGVRDVDGALTYCINAFGNALYAADIVSEGSAIPTSTPTHIEARVVLHGSAGSVTWYINGVEDVSTTGINTISGGAGCDHVTLAAALSSSYGEVAGLPNNWKIGDVVAHVGSSPIGDVRVFYLPCDTAGTDADFSPSAGDNEDNVDEVGPDEDATYNESDGTAGHRDSFLTSGLGGVTVLSVGPLVRTRKEGAGSGTLKVGVIHSSSESQSSAIALSDAYLSLMEFFDACPSGGGWDATKVTAAELSYEVGA